MIKLTTPSALFESWRGGYSDSPRRISEVLRREAPGIRQRWVSADGAAFPTGTVQVPRHTPEYFARLVGSRLLVTNDIVSRHVVKGPQVTYLQTWHGTPLKLLGLDERANSYSGAAAHRKRMLRDVAKWDYLISPSPACTEIFRSAFPFEGPVWETGYPRNDVLRSPEAAEIRRRVRDSLGIAEGATAVLHAPTWRDDEQDARGHLAQSVLDYEALAGLMPDDVVLLARMHKNVAVPQVLPQDRRFLDVSHHPDIAELYLAADALVSDYSSAAYDFAVTGKPIVLFAPDLDRYRDRVRGMYFDYEEWAPGPVLSSVEELAEAVADLEAVRVAHKERYAAFVDTFCPHEDGRAGERVVELLLGVLRP